MHYKITWMGENGRYYERTGLSAQEMKDFIRKKGWENIWNYFGPEIECEENPLFVIAPAAFMYLKDEK